MSNLIKSPYVNLKGKKAVIIDNNSKQGKFTAWKDSGLEIQTIGETEAGRAMAQLADAGQEKETGTPERETEDGTGFQEGIKVTNFDALFQKRQKEAEDEAEQVIRAAQEKAEEIEKEAQTSAEAARKQGYDEGKEEGRREGLALAEQEIRSREKELAEAQKKQQEELSECMASAEEKYVDVVISLVKKLTGIVIEDRDDLVLYLIRSAAEDLEPSSGYRIRVSSEDFYFLESHRDEAERILGKNASLEFVEEKDLEKNQCIIETDSQMVDCGFQTQMDTLIRDLKMLVR